MFFKFSVQVKDIFTNPFGGKYLLTMYWKSDNSFQNLPPKELPMFLPSTSPRPGCRDIVKGEWGAAKGVKHSSEGLEGILKETGRAEDALSPTGVHPVGWPGGVLRVEKEGLAVSAGPEAPRTATRMGLGKTVSEIEQRTHESQIKRAQRTRAAVPETEKCGRRCDW